MDLTNFEDVAVVNKQQKKKVKTTDVYDEIRTAFYNLALHKNVMRFREETESLVAVHMGA